MTFHPNTPESLPGVKACDRAMLVLAAGLGGASLMLFVVFLCAGPLRLVELQLGSRGDLAVDAGLSMLFFVQHSWMVRRSFRERLARIVPTHYLSAVYAIASGIALLVVVLLWQESRHLVWQASNGPWWAARMIFVLGLGVGIWGGLSLKTFDSFGLQPIRDRFRVEPARPTALVVRGAYRWVRHPLYLAVLLMIWSYPVLTADRLLFNVLWTLWIVIGTVLEERDLRSELGDEYRDYQRDVPMLLPTRFPR